MYSLYCCYLSKAFVSSRCNKRKWHARSSSACTSNCAFGKWIIDPQLTHAPPARCWMNPRTFHGRYETCRVPSVAFEIWGRRFVSMCSAHRNAHHKQHLTVSCVFRPYNRIHVWQFYASFTQNNYWRVLCTSERARACVSVCRVRDGAGGMMAFRLFHSVQMYRNWTQTSAKQQFLCSNK